jgi:hypothetical protein
MTMTFALAACRRDSGSAPAHTTTTEARREPGRTDAARATTSDAAAANADASRPGTTAAGASQSFAGTAEGRGADPPIHEFAPRAGADAWHGTGDVRLEIDANGAIHGTITMSGLALAVNGRRAGDRIVATLEQTVGADSRPIAIEGVDSGPPEGLFRGTVDADVTGGSTLRGTWEASAGAGVHRRRGTIEAHAR